MKRKAKKTSRRARAVAKPTQTRRARAQRGEKAGKFVYTFGGGRAEGHAGMKELLGGKGANLHEMAGLGLPVPPGFTISTAVCTHFYAHGRRYPSGLRDEVAQHLRRVEQTLG